MIISRNTLLAAIFTVGTLTIVAQDSQACRGGRSSGGYSSRGYSSSYRNSYSNHGSYGYSAPRFSSYSQPSHSYAQPVQLAPAPQPLPPQMISAQPVQQPATQPTAIQQVSQQQVVAPQSQVPQQPRVSQTPQPQVAQPQAQPPVTAQMSALQALGGFAPPQNTTPQAPVQQQIQTPAHVGSWTATLGNGATVRLALQADGNFSWVATNKAGSASSFAGSYTVSNGALSLNRSNDNQKLDGTMKTNGTNAFSFTVAGNNAAAINFSRS